jgi:hypothetical protein
VCCEVHEETIALVLKNSCDDAVLLHLRVPRTCNVVLVYATPALGLDSIVLFEVARMNKPSSRRARVGHCVKHDAALPSLAIGPDGKQEGKPSYEHCVVEERR